MKCAVSGCENCAGETSFIGDVCVSCYAKYSSSLSLPKLSGSDIGQALADLANLYNDRNKIYGDDYKRHGSIMHTFFPNGVHLNSADDFNRYAIIKNLVTKLNRYIRNFEKGGHADSLDDISVYAQMLQELDKKGGK